MRINLLFVVLLSFCFTYQSALAQGENMNWHYGRNLSLNFGQTPLTLGTSQVNVMEGCSSVSDASGNLLFYTTGFKIWDKNGVEMPNATGLQGNGPILPPQPDPYGSGYKSVYIIKHPGNSQRYFVVSGDPYEETIKKLYYHVVDMSLNSGLGDVVPGQKNIEIMTDVSENLSVIGGADCSTYWLVAPKNGYSDQYYTFKIDAAGFHNTPVISTLPMPIYGMKELFQTKDRSTVVGVTNTHLFTMAFDGVNGTLSNLDTISTSLSAGAHYNSSPGISKDKAKFYFGNGLLSNLYQVDLDLLPNLTAVKNSMTEVIPPPGVSANLFYLRTAPVGDKIYVIHHLYINNGLTPYLSSLDNASQPAAQVVYTQSALPFAPPGNPYAIYYSLGTDVVVNPPSDSLFNIASDTAICEQDTLRLSSTNPNATQFEWSTGATTAAITVTQSGTYWVKSSNACDIVFDTFRVNFLIPEVTLPADTTLCTGKSLVIEPVANNADRYLWNTGATSPTLTVTSPGTYTVEITTGQGCKASDTINIKEISSYVTILQKDTLICNSMPIVIKAISNLESTFSWNNGTTGSLLTPTESGKYVVTAVNRCGSFTDDVSVEVIDCNCSVKIPDAFTPNGDGINDVLAPAVAEGCNMQTFNFRVYNRFGQLVFTGVRPGQGWDGYFKNRPAETGTYMYYLEYKDRYSGSSVQLKGDLTLMR